MAAIAATLARYSEQIITNVTHPVTGLPSRSGWLPNVKEVFEACEAEANADRQKLARERRIKEQLALREEEDRLKDQAPTLEQLQAKYGPNYGLTPHETKKTSAFKAPSWQAISSMYSADPARIQRLIKAADDQHPRSEEAAE